MPEHRRRFSPQFKAEAVQMVLETRKPIAEIARDLGIHDGTLGNWVNTWRRETRSLSSRSVRWNEPG
jgi:transposase-like protein